MRTAHAKNDRDMVTMLKTEKGGRVRSGPCDFVSLEVVLNERSISGDRKAGSMPRKRTRWWNVLADTQIQIMMLRMASDT